MKIHIDGNPKEVCCVAEGQRPERAKLDGTNTSNVAKYRAVLFGLYKHPEATEVCSDSRLVIKQLNGEYTVKNERLEGLVDRIYRRWSQLGHEVKFTWIPKENNLARKVLG